MHISYILLCVYVVKPNPCEYLIKPLGIRDKSKKYGVSLTEAYLPYDAMLYEKTLTFTPRPLDATAFLSRHGIR